MRNNVPQIETAEIADTDLDAISGGVSLGVDGGAAAGPISGGASLGVDAALPQLPSVSDVTGTATGLAAGL